MKTQAKAFDGRKMRSLYSRLIIAAALLFAGWALLAPGAGLRPAEAQAEGPGRILSSTGGQSGGLVVFNTDGTNAVNLTSNSFDTQCGDGFGHKDRHASVSRDGKLIAFQSAGRDRANTSQSRIYVMNGDGTNVRQLTFNVPADEFQASEVSDRHPVILPDGTRVAFISNRSVFTHPGQQGGPSFQLRPDDIYVVNTDGTGLQKVTSFQPNRDGGAAGSSVVSVVWSPDGSRLAFRGVRMRTVGDPPQTEFNRVVSTISPGGGDESLVAILNSTGQSFAIDWSPDVRYIVADIGGEAQGAPPPSFAILDLQASEENRRSDILVGQAPKPGPGGIRFSPDSSRLAYNSNGQLAFVGIGGGSVNSTGVQIGDNPIWWQAGAPVHAPALLELAPDPVTVWGGQSVQMTPTLFDAQGNVIVRAATAWRLDICSGSTARVSNTGVVTGVAGVNYTGQVCASNGGLSDCATLQNFDTPSLSVSATTPETSKSGTGAPGVFTITRAGNPNPAVAINFTLSGTAIRDVDYLIESSAPISNNSIFMRSGEASVTLNVRPISSSQSSGDKTVILTLQPDASNSYFVNDQARTATITIKDNPPPCPTPTPTPSASPTPTPPPVISHISPNRGGDNGGVTIRIFGQRFLPAATVKLTRSGQPDILGGLVRVNETGTIMSAVFNLTGKARGTWSVVVTNPDGQAASLADAFTIEEGREQRIWADVVGRDVIRTPSAATYTAIVGNSGNTEAYGVFVFVTNIPRNATVRLGFNLMPVPRFEGLPADADPNQVPPVINTASGQTLPLFIPRLPGGSFVPLPIQITVPADQPDFSLRVLASSSLFRVIDDQTPVRGSGSKAGHGVESVREPSGPVRLVFDQNCFDSWKLALLDCVTSLLPGSECFKAAVDFVNLVANFAQVVASPPDSSGTSVGLSLSGFLSSVFSAAFAAAKCAGDVSPFGAAFDVASCGISFLQTAVTCFQEDKEKPVRAVRAVDPNDKVGANGVGTPRYLSGEEPMRYMILFENKPDATAPAQEVVITDQLDPSRFDFSTFQLGHVSFGNRIITPPPGLSQWTTDVDLRPANNLIVRINAGLNQTTGLVTWRFTSLDPATMQPTTDPLAGFLPPNRTSPEGEGSVFFTVMPKAGLQTGTEIRNGARIVFDQNEHIDTPVWLNTIDNSKPQSQVQPLAAQQTSTDFTVSWAGTDTGPGLATYTIYVSEGGGPFTVWRSNTTATSGVFNGKGNTTYAFYSVARDAAGNTEDAPASADATTTTAACSFSLSAASQAVGAGSGTGSVGVTTGGACAWAAASNADWITITSGANSTGSGTVNFSVAVNTGAARTGTVTVAGQTFTVTQAAAAPSVQFAASSLSVGEGAGSVAVAVTRSGDTSVAASVDYRTADTDTFTVGCADAAGAQGSAYARCDFATVVGTLAFAPGETSKTVTVPIIDDAHVEGAQSFQVVLSNAAGASLGSLTTATVTIQDNDAAGAQNPVTSSNFSFFVRQQYLDFLSREPDQAGFDAWLGVLNNCPNPFTGPEVQSGCDRIFVSGEGFFRSEEFRLKGAYVFRLYRAAFNRLPEYAEIISDMSFVAGATEAELFARRAELPARFTQREEFQRLYGQMTNEQYVAALLGRYQLQRVTTRDPAAPDAGAKVVLTAAELAGLARDKALRAVADSDEVTAAEFDNAFVAMQYYGYLRRKPEAAGFEAWLQVLRSGDTRTMVNGFLNSVEYKLRFGQP